MIRLLQLWMSSLVGFLVGIKYPFGLHTLIKKWFIRYYKVEVKEAEFPVEKYVTLRDFFVRRLKANARPISYAQIISPVDGVWTQSGILGSVDKPCMTQIKDKSYSLIELLNLKYHLSKFKHGSYHTIYLAPYHYHRVHSPMDGQVISVAHVPGYLWPVNAKSVGQKNKLFTMNERIIVELQNKSGNRCFVVMVGATNVGAMSLDFYPQLRQSFWKTKPTYHKMTSKIWLKKGETLGCFHMGSTVIVLFDIQSTQENFPTTHFEKFLETKVKMGQELV